MFDNSDDTINSIVSAHAGTGGESLPPPPSDGNLPAPPAPPAAAPVEGQASGGFQWPEFPENDDAAPADRFAPFRSDDALSGWQLPPEARAAWAQEREFVRGIIPEYETFSQLKDTFAPLGGESVAPLAADLTGRLFGIIPPDDVTTERLTREFGSVENAPIHQLAMLDMLRQQNAPVYRDLVDAALMMDFDRVMGSLRDEVLRREGLSAEMMDSYRAVTQAGGYTAPADVAEIQAFKAQHPQHAAIIDRIPREVLQDLMDARPEAAKFHLETYADNFARKDREMTEQARVREQEAAAAETRFQGEVQKITTTFYDQYTNKATALGFDKMQALGLTFETQRRLQEMAASDPTMQRLDRELTRAIRDNNQPLRDTVLRQYEQIAERVWRQTINANNPQRARLANVPPAAPSQQSSGAPNATAAQFPPAQPSGSAQHPDDVISALVSRFARS